MSGYFVTGTDTDSGKTFTSLALIRALKQQGHRVAPFKPVAAGAEVSDGQLKNADALQLIQACDQRYPYELVNPYCFAPAIAPHIAAAELGLTINLARLENSFKSLSELADKLVVEGAGGWRVPLSDDLDISGLAVQLQLPVILVVGLKLGCINHALLTAEAIVASGLRLAAWVGCEVEAGMPRRQENIDTLFAAIDAPCLGVLDYDAENCPDNAANALDMAVLVI